MWETLKKLNTFLNKDRSKPIPQTYKLCPCCGGLGYEDFFTECPVCNQEGIVKKTYQEYIDSLDG